MVRRALWSMAGTGVIGLGLLGCDPQVEPDDEVRSRSGPTAGGDFAIAPRRGRVIGGERVDREIDWPMETPIDASAREDLSAPSSDAIARSPVPVLIPTSVADGGLVMAGDDWYAFSGRGEGLTVAVQGSAVARVYPHIRAEKPSWTIRGHGGYVTRNEGIWSVSWIEHGAAYSLELECAKPFEGPCRDEAYVLDLADQMTYVGGKEDPR